jgi:hypothetical protein
MIGEIGARMAKGVQFPVKYRQYPSGFPINRSGTVALLAEYIFGAGAGLPIG